MITSMIIVRIASKAEYGLYQQFLLISTTFVNILGLGLNSSLYYFYPIESRLGKQQIVVQTLILHFIIGFTFLILFLGFSIPRLEWLNLENLATWKWHIGIYIFLMLGTSILQVIFTVEKNVTFNRFYYPVEKILRMIIIISFLFFFQDDIALINAIIILAVFRTIFVFYHLRHYFLYGVKKLYFFPKNQLAYALPIGASIILGTISGKIDKFIVTDLVNLNEFAIYSVAVICIPILTMFFTSIANSIMPQIVLYCKLNKLKMAKDLWKLNVLKNASVTIPIVLFAMIMANEIIEVLYTQKYSESAKYFQILIFAYLFIMFNRGMFLRGFQKTQVIFYIMMISTIITIIVGLLIIPKYLLYGAAITAVIGVGLPTIITILFEKILLKTTWNNLIEWKKIGQLLLISLGSSIILVLVKYSIQNIHLALFAAGLLYSFSIYYWQKKYDLLLFPNLLSKLLSKKSY